MADEASHTSYLIIGSGVFGASTALHLAEKYSSSPSPSPSPPPLITLVDRPVLPYHKSASRDTTRIIRADYPDALYVQLALEARTQWRTNPLYSEFYHETGLIWVDVNRTGFGNDVIANYHRLGVNARTDAKCRLLSPDEIRRLHNGLFADADLDGISDDGNSTKQILLNESSGWAEANKTLEKVIEAAVGTGVVRRVETDIASLIFDEKKGACTGARTAGGQILSADSVILATGAETAKLLVESAPEMPNLHVGSRLSAAGLITGLVRLGQEEATQFRSGPAFLFAGGKTQGGMIPPTAENELKVTCDISFTNTIEISNNKFISTPPQNPISTYSALSTAMTRALVTVCKGMLGERARNYKFEDCRICWDAITPDQDFIICAHPHCKNLFVATGGSFHAWKFLPILGKYVVQMLDEELDRNLIQRWAWDRDSTASGANERMMPVREMRDI